MGPARIFNDVDERQTNLQKEPGPCLVSESGGADSVQ
jgi:hypothetical protein